MMTESSPPESSPPDCVVQVSDDSSAVAAVRDAIASGVPLVDYGRAHDGLGNPPPLEHTVLRAVGKIIEHYQRDFTVRVAAGCTVGDLNSELAKTGQFLPVDADDDLTIGELVGHNVYGPLCLAYGTMRDLLLGLGFVDGQGRLNKVGGRTVKNVAGYDMTRFMVGAMGELGLLTELTLRTYALPTQTLAVDLSIDEPELIDSVLPQWLLSDAAPAWLWLTRQQQQFVLHLAYYGKSTACMTQLRSLETFIDTQTGLHIIGTAQRSFAQDQSERSAHSMWRRLAGALVKVIVPPASSGFVCQSLAQHPLGESPHVIQAIPSHGCIFVGGRLSAAHAQQLDEQIERIIAGLGGFRVWYRRPSGGENIKPFAPPQPDWPLLGKLKNTLDPHGLLNPGRFLPVGEPAA